MLENIFFRYRTSEREMIFDDGECLTAREAREISDDSAARCLDTFFFFFFFFKMDFIVFM